MFDKFIGIGFIIVALKVLFIQDWRGNWIDYRFSNNYIYMFLGISLLVIGITWLYSAFKSTKPKPQAEHTICPTCKQTYNFTDLKDGKCPTCDIDTIEIEHYYKDNPFKEDEKE